jgi:hypothetical protein
MTRPNLKVTAQGKAHVANVNGDWMAIFPDGTMRAFMSYPEAAKAAERWFRRDAARRKLAVGVGITEIDPNMED